MPIHETLPLLLGAGLMPVLAASAYVGFGTSLRTPKTAAGDEAAQQAHMAREERHSAVKTGK